MIQQLIAWVARLTRRPDKTEWAFIVALAVSTRGECKRRRVGAVIIDEAGRIAGAGYNGSHRGGPSCLEGDCPRASSGVPAGSSYDTGPGACHAIHAELNALLDVSDKNRLGFAALYVTTEPCEGCLKILRSTGIRTIRWLDRHGTPQTAYWPYGNLR